MAIPMHDGLKAAKLIDGGASVMINITVIEEEEEKESSTDSGGSLISRIAMEARSSTAGNGASSNVNGLTHFMSLLAIAVTIFLRRQF